jgi:sigma-B regulation protein RsbU (phosphoserine phosphatase)
MNVRSLEKVPLFQNLPSSELEYLAGTLRVREIAPDTILIIEGNIGDRFYIIISGEFEVIKALGTDDERVIAVRHSGDFVGELSFVNPDRLRIASVRACTPARVWEMTHDEFDALLHRQPQLAFVIVEVLSQRLTDSHNLAIRELHEINLQLAQAYEELKAAQEQIVQKEKLEQELQLAYEIQMSILPQTLPQLANFNFGARIVPARSVGGDFFDIFRLDADNVGIVVGDVADKGVPSAIAMARTHALLYAEASRGSEPVDVLQGLNRHLVKITETSFFVTAIYGILNRNTNEFKYARAGHQPPIVVWPEGRVSLASWREGQLLGFLNDPILDEQVLIVPPGGCLLLYTDGIIDCRNPQGESFGMDRLLDEVSKLITVPAQNRCDRLLEKLFTFQSGAVQDDDVTLVAVHSSA